MRDSDDPVASLDRARWSGSRRKVTIDTVAAAAAVSRQTVTNTLHYPERVRPATRARVQEQIDLLGYSPSAAARSLRARRSGAIGVELNALGPRYRNATMTPLLAELSVAASGHGAHMVTFGSASDAPTLAAYEDMWRTQTVDAFVIADTHRGDPRPAWLAGHGIPFVSFGQVWDDPAFTRWVDVDGAAGTAAAVAHCVAQGYRTVGYLGWPAGTSVVGETRHDGWVRACGDHALPTDGLAAVAEEDLDAAVAAADLLVDRLPSRSAVVCASDVLAVAVHQVLARRGLTPGADLGVVGFDDSELARMHHLTSVAQPVAAVAEHLLDLLEEEFLGRATSRPTGVLLEPAVHPRGSTGAAAAPDPLHETHHTTATTGETP